VSINDCVVFAIENSFEVKLARLDLYIAETGLMYSEAVFDTFLSGGYKYSEDRRKRISSALSKYDYINSYYAGIEKTLPSGTEVGVKFTDARSRLQTDYAGIGFYHVPEFSIDLKQPVGKNTFGYTDRGKITLTRLAIENAALDMQDKIEALIAKVERAYWDLVHAKRRLSILDGILEKARKLHGVNEKNYDLGLIEKVDLVSSEANLARVEAEVLVAANSYKRSEEDLKLLMNMGEGIDIVPGDILNSPILDEDLPECIKESFLMRRDYKEAVRDTEIKGLNLKMKENETWPEIDIVSSMALNGLEADAGNAMSEIVEGQNPYYYVGLDVKVPLENKEARSEAIKAKHEKEKALVTLKDIERKIITEVGNAFREVVTFEASLVYISSAVKLQAEKLSEEEKRFNYGRSSTKTIIDYQNDLLRTELEEAGYFLEHRKSKVDLERSMNVILGKYEEII